MAHVVFVIDQDVVQAMYIAIHAGDVALALIDCHTSAIGKGIDLIARFDFHDAVFEHSLVVLVSFVHSRRGSVATSVDESVGCYLTV